MIDCQLQALDARQGVLQSLPNIVFIVRELSAQLIADHARFPFIGDQADTPEHDHTVDVQRPFAIPAVSGIVDTVADFVGFTDRVDLVPCLSAIVPIK